MKWFKCYHCKIEFDESHFYRDKSKPVGFKPRCKGCERLYVDQTKRKDYERIYRLNHLEKRKEIVLKSIQKNIDHHRLVQEKYRSTEGFRVLHRKHGATRRARMVGAFIEIVDYQQVFKKYNGACFYCGKKLLFSETEFDHFFPISRGGKHETSNIRCSCITCNRKKAARLPQEVYYQMV